MGDTDSSEMNSQIAVQKARVAFFEMMSGKLQINGVARIFESEYYEITIFSYNLHCAEGTDSERRRVNFSPSFYILVKIQLFVLYKGIQLAQSHIVLRFNYNEYKQYYIIIICIDFVSFGRRYYF